MYENIDSYLLRLPFSYKSGTNIFLLFHSRKMTFLLDHNYVGVISLLANLLIVAVTNEQTVIRSFYDKIKQDSSPCLLN